MAYTPLQWLDESISSPYGGVSAERLAYIESGIVATATVADAAQATAATATTAASAAAIAAAASVQRVPFIDVRAIGAVGAADDSATWQAAHDALPATGGILFYNGPVSLVQNPIAITKPAVKLVMPAWQQTTPGTQSGIQANIAGLTSIINATGEGFQIDGGNVDGNGQAVACLVMDALNQQIRNMMIRRPGTNGVGVSVTSNGTSPWFSDCRFNGANQAGSVGFSVGGTDSTMVGCKAVNCLDSVQYLSGASGAIQQACHHTPGSAIGRCAINIAGQPGNVQLIGNRIDNHALGSGIQITPGANTQGVQIVGNLFFQNVITNNTFAAIGVDTTSAHVYQLVVNGNVVRSATSHAYAALLTAQKLDGTAASNPTRISSDGTTVNGNSVYATAMFGTSSSPLMGRGNVLSTDGTTWAVSTDVG